MERVWPEFELIGIDEIEGGLVASKTVERPHCGKVSDPGGLNDRGTWLYPAGTSNLDWGIDVVCMFVTRYVAASPISMRNVTPWAASVQKYTLNPLLGL